MIFGMIFCLKWSLPALSRSWLWEFNHNHDKSPFSVRLQSPDTGRFFVTICATILWFVSTCPIKVTKHDFDIVPLVGKQPSACNRTFSFLEFIIFSEFSSWSSFEASMIPDWTDFRKITTRARWLEIHWNFSYRRKFHFNFLWPQLAHARILSAIFKLSL